MLEIPEANVISSQLDETTKGKSIIRVIAAQSPHKFAWYAGDPLLYNDLLHGKTVTGASARGGMVEMTAEDVSIVFSDGANIKLHQPGEKWPEKHQLLIEFADHSAISASVQMYGGLCCFKSGTYDNAYYQVAGTKPSPLSDEFDQDYFAGIINVPEHQKLSAKALLATEQRIPGLGNGVLQDILFNAGIHPKRKVCEMAAADQVNLFKALKRTLSAMIAQGGRDTEKDLFGQFGRYKSILSKLTANTACKVCGQMIVKESYLGGSIYFCPRCQKK